jgi:hypothetical protein
MGGANSESFRALLQKSRANLPTTDRHKITKPEHMLQDPTFPV